MLRLAYLQTQPSRRARAPSETVLHLDHEVIAFSFWPEARHRVHGAALNRGGEGEYYFLELEPFTIASPQFVLSDCLRPIGADCALAPNPQLRGYARLTWPWPILIAVCCSSHKKSPIPPPFVVFACLRSPAISRRDLAGCLRSAALICAAISAPVVPSTLIGGLNIHIIRLPALPCASDAFCRAPVKLGL